METLGLKPRKNPSRRVMLPASIIYIGEHIVISHSGTYHVNIASDRYLWTSYSPSITAGFPTWQQRTPSAAVAEYSRSWYAAHSVSSCKLLTTECFYPKLKNIQKKKENGDPVFRSRVLSLSRLSAAVLQLHCLPTRLKPISRNSKTAYSWWIQIQHVVSCSSPTVAARKHKKQWAGL